MSHSLVPNRNLYLVNYTSLPTMGTDHTALFDAISSAVSAEALHDAASNLFEDGGVLASKKQNVLISNMKPTEFDPHKIYESKRQVSAEIDVVKSWKTNFLRKNGHDPCPGKIRRQDPKSPAA